MQAIIDLIENGDTGDAFEQLAQLGLLKGDLLQLESEFTQNIRDANYEDRLKTAIRRAFRTAKKQTQKPTEDSLDLDLEETSITTNFQPRIVQNIIPETESYFVGREADLMELESIFEENKFIAIVGAGGMGKTQLVSKYLEKHPIPKEQLCWIQCEPTTSLDSIMEQLGYAELLKTKDQKDFIKINNFLFRLEQEKRYLFLEDYHDINEKELIENCLSHSKKILANSKIILISRDEVRSLKLSPRQFDLKGFQSDEDLSDLIDNLSAFFNFGSRISLNQEDLLSLAKQLDGHPLAIYLAFHLLESGHSITDIEKEIINLGSEEMDSNKKETVSERLLNAIFTRSDASPDEQQFIKEFSVFRGMVKEDVIKAVLSKSNSAITDKLKRKNILKLNRKDDDLHYYLHPLVREFCYEQLKVNATGLAHSIMLHLRVAQYFMDKRSTIISIIEEERIHYHLIRANAWDLIAKDIEELGEAMIAQGHLDHLENLMNQLKGAYAQVPKIALAFRGLILYQKGHINEAAEFFLQAENERDLKTRIKGILGYGELLYDRGKREVAYKKFTQVLKLLEDKPNTFLRERIFALLSVGVYNIDKGIYDKSLQLFKETEDLAKNNNLISELATALDNSGAVYYQKGEYSKALKLHNQGFEFRKELGEQSKITFSLNNIASIHRSKKEYNKALILYEKSLDISEQLGEQSRIAFALNSIASIHSDKGKDNKALNLYQQSLKIRQELGEQFYIASSLHNIGSIKKKQNKIQESILYFFQSLLIKSKLEIPYKNQLSWLLSIKKEIGLNTYKKLIEQALPQYDKDLQAIFTEELRQEVLDAPIRKATTIGRNDKVEAKYANGDIKIVKYKKVETAHKNGEVEILQVFPKS